MNFCLYMQDFEQVSDFFYLVIQFKFGRKVCNNEKYYNLLCTIFFGKYFQLTKNFKLSWAGSKISYFGNIDLLLP